MKNETVSVQLSDTQYEVFKRLAEVCGAAPADVLLALACDRLAGNLVHADAPDAELRFMLWDACHLRTIRADNEWGLSEWIPVDVSTDPAA